MMRFYGPPLRIGKWYLDKGGVTGHECAGPPDMGNPDGFGIKHVRKNDFCISCGTYVPEEIKMHVKLRRLR